MTFAYRVVPVGWIAAAMRMRAHRGRCVGHLVMPPNVYPRLGTARSPLAVAPTLIVDDGGDATLLIHKGYELEEYYAKHHDTPKITTDIEEERIIENLIREVLKKANCFECASQAPVLLSKTCPAAPPSEPPADNSL